MTTSSLSICRNTVYLRGILRHSIFVSKKKKKINYDYSTVSKWVVRFTEWRFILQYVNVKPQSHLLFSNVYSLSGSTNGRLSTLPF